MTPFLGGGATIVDCELQDFVPCGEAVLGIIEIFKKKFYHPPVLIVKRCYEILVYVLDQLYQNASALEHTGMYNEP